MCRKFIPLKLGFHIIEKTFAEKKPFKEPKFTAYSLVDSPTMGGPFLLGLLTHTIKFLGAFWESSASDDFRYLSILSNI